MQKTKNGVVIYNGKKIDMYEFSRWRIVNKLSRPSDVCEENVKLFLADRSAGNGCSGCGADLNAQGNCTRCTGVSHV